MTKIITENFKTETTHSLFDSLASDNYYVMASTSLNSTEFAKESTITNTQFDKRDFQKKVIFANRVTQENARYMFYCHYGAHIYSGKKCDNSDKSHHNEYFINLSIFWNVSLCFPLGLWGRFAKHYTSTN